MNTIRNTFNCWRIGIYIDVVVSFCLVFCLTDTTGLATTLNTTKRNYLLFFIGLIVVLKFLSNKYKFRVTGKEFVFKLTTLILSTKMIKLQLAEKNDSLGILFLLFLLIWLFISLEKNNSP